MIIYDLAKEKGYRDEKELYLLENWLRYEKNICSEIFFSMFHKKWSINNYFIDLKKLKKIERNNDKIIYYKDYSDALNNAIIEMLEKI